MFRRSRPNYSVPKRQTWHACSPENFLHARCFQSALRQEVRRRQPSELSSIFAVFNNFVDPDFALRLATKYSFDSHEIWHADLSSQDACAARVSSKSIQRSQFRSVFTLNAIAIRHRQASRPPNALSHHQRLHERASLSARHPFAVSVAPGTPGTDITSGSPNVGLLLGTH